MFRSPILFREVITTFRKYRTFVTHAVLLIALAAVMFVLLPGVASAKPGEHSSIGREIYVWLAWLKLVLIACAAPAAAAATITLEKERNTLDLLLITDLTRFEIGFGKFFSRLYNLFVMVMLALPMLAILLTVGGISGTEVIQVMAQVLGLGVLALGLGFFFSVLVKKSYSAIVLSYVVMAFYAGTTWKLVDTGVFGPATAVAVSPISNFAFVLDPRVFGLISADGWYVNPLFNVVAGFSLAFLGSWCLPYASNLERWMSPAYILTRLFGRRDRSLRDTLGLHWVTTRERKKGVSRPVANNPIYWLESTSSPFGRMRLGWPSYAVAALLLFSIVAFGASFEILDEPEFYYWTISGLIFLLVVIATIRAATSVVIQRENKSQMLLATTPIDEGTYLRGLILGLTRSLMFLLIIPMSFITLMTIAGYLGLVPQHLTIWAIPYSAVVLTAMLAFYVVQGICISFLVKSSIRALVLAVVAVVAEMAAPAAMCCCAFPINPIIIARNMPAVVKSPEAIQYQIEPYMIPLIIGASLVAQLVYCLILYSVMKSGFDRYLDRNI